MMLEPGFWDDQQGAQVIINEGNGLKAIVNEYKELEETHENLDMTLELLREEPDEELQEELGKELVEFQQKMADFELQLLLSGPYDQNNAILELHPGAGEQSHKTGVLCFYVCIHDGLRSVALKWRQWIIFLVMKQGLNL